MSVLGALGRSRTYSESASEAAKTQFRKALREKLDEVSKSYKSIVPEEEHLSNIKNLSEDLTSEFRHCLRNGRLRIGIVQKALNLYLKYLWCVNLIAPPPHCPFDSIIIRCLCNCSDLHWTSIDTLDDYKRLVKGAQRVADGRPLTEWELEIWLMGVQSERKRKGTEASRTDKGVEGGLPEPFRPSTSNIDKEEEAVISGTVTSQGVDSSKKDICEILVSKASADSLPHEYGQKKYIDMTIGNIPYEAGVHETQKGVVWISSVLYRKTPRREKAKLVDALAEIGIEKGDKVTITRNEDGTFLLQA
ncbi:MAG: hypothetical protein OS130_05860 [Thermodesulfobacteriota bacterium]|nr:MAG: hypothetical protein OS130_05860 [Thermodesulfobacteriota bacterium]